MLILKLHWELSVALILELHQRIVTTSWILSWTNKNIIATFSYNSKKMSTSSSTTALGRDPVPTDDPTLKAWMCMFIIIQKDGTAFEVTFITEEDIMQICMTLGHIHPLGVLWYLAMELVALFHMAEEMQQASHGAIKAMELCNKPIAIKVVAPTEPHIRAYITIGGSYPSKPWSLYSEEEADTNSPTGNPHWGGGTLQCLQAELGDLTDQELWQLMEDLHQEIALHKQHAPPSNPQPTPWGKPSGSSNFNEDDQEVTFPRGGGWVPPGQQSPTPGLVQPDGGWAPLGPPPQPLRPASADPNLAKVPRENSRLWGGMPPQRPTIPRGAQAYKRLNKVSAWQPQDHILPANGHSQKSWEWNRRCKREGESMVICCHWCVRWLKRAGWPNCQVDGCSKQSRIGHSPC